MEFVNTSFRFGIGRSWSLLTESPNSVIAGSGLNIPSPQPSLAGRGSKARGKDKQ